MEYAPMPGRYKEAIKTYELLKKSRRTEDIIKNFTKRNSRLELFGSKTPSQSNNRRSGRTSSDNTDIAIDGGDGIGNKLLSLSPEEALRNKLKQVRKHKTDHEDLSKTCNSLLRNTILSSYVSLTGMCLLWERMFVQYFFV